MKRSARWKKGVGGFDRLCVGPPWIARPAVRRVQQLQHAGSVGHHGVDQHAEHVARGLAVHAAQGGVGPAGPQVGAGAGSLGWFGGRHVHQRAVGREAADDPLQLLAGERRAHLAGAGSIGRRDVHRSFHVPQPPQAVDTGVALAELGEQLFLKLTQIRLAGRRAQRV